MNFTREINRLMAALLVAFGLMLVAAAYYAVLGRVTLLEREDNPRLVEAQQSILRGAIYDRNGVLLARTQPDESGFAVREYLHPAMYSAIGYYSYRYGTGGAEDAFDNRLSGADLPPTFNQLVLAQPAQGENIQLTLDLTVQQRIVDLMGDEQGAVIVTSVPAGDVLALVSLPTFNPNTLDDDWDMLIQTEGNPFFNRVLQGRYQPGTMMQMPVMVNAITRGQSVNAQFPGGAAPVQLDDLTLTCVTRPPQGELTLGQAYLYGCPAPFAQLAPVISVERFQNILDVLRLQSPPILTDFLPEEPVQEANENTAQIALTDEIIRENILGQGELNLSPISIHALTAAIANGGNTPQPHLLMAARTPAEDTWSNINHAEPSLPYMTAPTAQQMGDLLRQSAIEGTASLIDWGALDIRGQSAVAYSGESTIVWFSGYAAISTEQRVAVTVVLEDTDDIEAAINIAQQALTAARSSLAPTLE